MTNSWQTVPMQGCSSVQIWLRSLHIDAVAWPHLIVFSIAVLRKPSFLVLRCTVIDARAVTEELHLKGFFCVAGFAKM